MRYFIYLFLFLSAGCDLHKAIPEGSSGKSVEPGPIEAAPIAISFSASDISIGREKIINLQYTDSNSDLADSCSLSDLVNVSETTMCRCDQGICSVGITGDSIAAGSFQYTVTANSQTSNSANVSISIIERAAFVSTWRMGVAGYGNGNLRLELPISSAYDYEMTVDWGDGSPLSIVTDYFDDDRKHDYAVPEIIQLP